MSVLEYYEKLPETMSEIEIENELEQILRSENVSYFNSGILFEVLEEISYRFAQNHSELSPELCCRLTSLIKYNWEKNSLSSTQLLVSIVIGFRLKELYEYMQESYEKVSNIEVKLELQETFQEIRGYLD